MCVTGAYSTRDVDERRERSNSAPRYAEQKQKIFKSDLGTTAFE